MSIKMWWNRKTFKRWSGEIHSFYFYRRFKTGEFNVLHLPMQGKRKPNGYKEKRGKQAFKRNISERKKDIRRRIWTFRG